MSYHRALGMHPSEMPAPFTPTTAFAQAVDPYSFRMSPPGAIYSPYGWGPDFNIGMPFNYTHHIGYERVPVRRARPRGAMSAVPRRRFGRLYDVLSGLWSGGPGQVSSGGGQALGGVLAIL